MKILRTYFLKEFNGAMLLALVVLIFVFILGYLVQIAYLVINKGVSILSVLKLFLFRIPALLIYLVPIAALVAILLSIGRVSCDNEIVTMRASGINLFRIILPFLIVGLILSLFMVIINDRIIPYAHFAMRKTLIEVGIKNPTAALEPGVFINSFDKYILFIYSIEGNKLNNIYLYEPQGEDKPTRIIIAKKGEFISDPEKDLIKLKLMDGTADEPGPDNPYIFYKLNFKTYFLNLHVAKKLDSQTIKKKPKDMTIQQLKQEIVELKRQKIKALPLFTEINKKISFAFSSFVFILLGLPLAVITRRREKSVNFSIAVILTSVYYLLFLGSEILSLGGYLNPIIALWIPNTLFGLLGLSLTYQLCRR